MANVPCAVISSTAHDLPAHRAMALDACLRQDFFPVMMEHQAPGPADAMRLSRELVDRADVYILILGFRYGEIPAGQDKSFTHLELDRADECGIPKLVLLMAEDHPLTAAQVETGPGAERIHELREWLRCEQGVAFFSSPDQLRALLIDGLSDIRNELRPRGGSFHHVHQIATPPEPYVAHPYTLLQTAEVIGRHRELNVLTDWVTGSETRTGRARVMIFVAIGGMGKSAVTWKWFNDVAPQAMRPLSGRVWWSFYESDARFDNFVTRTLAYVSCRPLEQIEEMRAQEREDELLDWLDQEPYLVVLDGLERLLLAYARADAAHLVDDGLDRDTANFVAGALGLPPGAATSFTGQSRLRMAADPRVSHFLRRLTTLRKSRVLSTSRLFPLEIQTVTNEPVDGAATYFVTGLDDDDAVNLWRAFGVTGGREELVKLFRTFDNYPLLIRALAGEVARFRAAPGDFNAWRQAHQEFDPFRLPLVQRKSHVLQYALSGLTGIDNQVLRTIAAFRAPAPYDTLAALLVGRDKVCADEIVLDTVLTDLEDRGMVGWDRRGNRYDLHPVVRGVAWTALDPDARQDIYQSLASHFEALPVVDQDAVKSIDDLTGLIELYHTLLNLKRPTEATDILYSSLIQAGLAIWAFHELTEFTEMFAGNPELVQIVKDENGEELPMTMTFLGILYFLSGNYGRALAALGSLDSALAEMDVTENEVSFIRGVYAMVLCYSGKLAEAERVVRNHLSMREDAQDRQVNSSSADMIITVLAMVLIRRGQYEEGAAWLVDYRTTYPAASFGGQIWLSERAMAALRQGDATAALNIARIMTASEEQAMPHARSQAMAIRAAVAEAQGQRDVTYQMLTDALVFAREARLTDVEAGFAYPPRALESWWWTV